MLRMHLLIRAADGLSTVMYHIFFILGAICEFFSLLDWKDRAKDAAKIGETASPFYD